MRFKLALAFMAGLVVTPAVAADKPARGVYIGVFGGGGSGSATDVSQIGTAFFPDAAGGPLAVNASGRTDSGGVGFVGGQVGYELSSSPSLVRPAFEIEGFYLDAGTRRATLHNPTNRISEHTFDATYPMNNAVFLANMVVSFPTSYPGVTPYIGGGIGGALVTIDGAKSLQTNPSEGDLNHYNSGPDSSGWTFAAQAKAGVRVAIGRNAYVFGEYRYLYVGDVDQTFGSTVYASHVPTTAWTVCFDATSYHLATAGIGFDF